MTSPQYGHIFASWEECTDRNNLVCTLPTQQERCEMLIPSWRGNVVAERGELWTNRVKRMTDVQAQKDWGEAEQDMFASAGSGDVCLPLCNWCGQMTGNWCEHCHVQQPSKPKHAICKNCEDEIGMCRLCRLSLQVKRGKDAVTLRQTGDSCRQQKWACASCGNRDFKLQLCSGCMCARYCNYTCQKRDWPKHKPLCTILQKKQPLSFVYPWKLRQAEEVVSACQRWDLMEAVRYVRGAPEVAKASKP